VLTELVEHYNSARPHRGIDLEVPVPRVPDGPLDGSVKIRRIDRLGGVLREYSIALERNGPDYRGACCSVQFPQSRDA
jgi:putative transposase